MRISVNESWWKFKGHLQAMQYIPNKGLRFGVKVYKLAVSIGPTQEYMCTFWIYMGMDKGELPATMKAIVDLMGTTYLFGKGYEVNTNNWYTYPALFHYLQDWHTNAVRTLQAN